MTTHPTHTSLVSAPEVPLVRRAAPRRFVERVRTASLAATGAMSLVVGGARAQESIQPDRPDFLFAPTVVPVKTMQIEAGPNLAFTRGGGVNAASYSLPVQLRYGCTANAELRLACSPWNVERDEAANETADGVGDVELGTKVALCEEDGWRPQACVVVAGRFPTGSKDVSDRQFGASLAFSGAWDLGDGASWGALAGLSRTPDGSEDSVSGAFAVSIGRGFGDHASAYVELGVFPGFHAASSES